MPRQSPYNTDTTTTWATTTGTSSGTPGYTYVVNPTPAAGGDYWHRESWMIPPGEFNTTHFNPYMYFTTDDYEQPSPEKRDKAKFNMEEVW